MAGGFKSRLWGVSASIVALIATSATSTTIDDGKLRTVNGISYYSGGTAVSKIVTSADFNTTQFQADIVPITIIRTNDAVFTKHALKDTISNYSASDDVFQTGFLESVFLLYGGEGRSKADISTHQALQKLGSKVVLASPGYRPEAHLTPAKLSHDLPKGPYFFSPQTGDIYEAFRLYSDHQVAFTEGALSDGKGGFKSLPAAASGAMTKSVAVPSRLYYTPTSKKPLAGLRLGVKDIYHIKGLRTSGGNRAYYDLYSPQNTTGPAIQRLIDQGAIMVGKMGTVQFANGDNPTADWVDFHCPFNPRGDGYQAPGGSSSGPGAGIGAYDWLDIAVGSDTGGSMRSPAGMQGLFANRPSTGAVSLDDVIPLCHALDTAGVFSRDATTWSKVIHAWYQNFTDYREYPKKIFYQDSSFPTTNTSAGALLEEFVVKVENFLSTKREHVNISSQWEKTHPSAAAGEINDVLNTTYAFLTSVDQYRSLAQPFYADYAKKHEGRRPFINPGPLARWTWGQNNGGNAAFTEALQNKTLFKSWWETEGYGKADKSTCSEGIYLYPYTQGDTQYRNVYFSAPTAPPLGFSNGRIAVLAGTPDMIVPVGEVAYNSTISLKEEYMPVTMSFGAARGCDFMLVNLIEDLEKAGIVKPVSTGSMMYPS